MKDFNSQRIKLGSCIVKTPGSDDYTQEWKNNGYHGFITYRGETYHFTSKQEFNKFCRDNDLPIIPIDEEIDDLISTLKKFFREF